MEKKDKKKMDTQTTKTETIQEKEQGPYTKSNQANYSFEYNTYSLVFKNLQNNKKQQQLTFLVIARLPNLLENQNPYPS